MGSCSIDGKWLATGSDMGIINMYSCNKLYSEYLNGNIMGPYKAVFVSPNKTIFNLTTSINSIKFSSDGEFAVIASNDALRIVRLPSCKSLTNWPTSKTPL